MAYKLYQGLGGKNIKFWKLILALIGYIAFMIAFFITAEKFSATNKTINQNLHEIEKEIP